MCVFSANAKRPIRMIFLCLYRRKYWLHCIFVYIEFIFSEKLVVIPYFFLSLCFLLSKLLLLFLLFIQMTLWKLMDFMTSSRNYVTSWLTHIQFKNKRIRIVALMERTLKYQPSCIYVVGSCVAGFWTFFSSRYDIKKYCLCFRSVYFFVTFLCCCWCCWCWWRKQ